MEEKLSIVFVACASLLAIILWHKKINPDTTWIYAIYVILLNIIFSLSVLIN